ncbi:MULTISPECIES: MerC domain-containing protein [unclassified Pseudoalteromonas]|jgi:MFS family permease|uniref:MerC domain-containing protein n=2 Tax=Pseudoalteromonas TaxID=53246 RepID=UPI00110B5736|nr:MULTISPECIES: MerC domain-containing protein [unclassified Pseudoalteromonas]MDN3413420.1 MerC domain-containing protein [Pseudoalteromonas sp. APC 3250]TMP51320.1 MerC domain-containing protein [Pseudoalteromonas sp. S1688]
MKLTQTTADKFAIGLSLMCTVHCFATPVILALLPSFAVLQINGEQFHLWVLAAVLPTSLLALSLGCKKHKRTRYMACGVVGLAFLIIAVLLGYEEAEKALTLIGSAFIALAHWFNYQQCFKKNNENCPCSGDKSDQLV